jgi:hypothetical protein
MKKNQIIKQILLICVSFFFFALTFSACSIDKPDVLTQKATVTNIQPSPVITAQPSPTLLPTVDPINEITNQINLFLDSEKPYRQNEDFYWSIFRPQDNQYEPKLGIMSINIEDRSLDFQGVLLGWVEASDGIVVFLGVQDEKEVRFVTPVKIYDENYEIYKDINSGFIFLIKDKYNKITIKDPVEFNSKIEVEKFLTTKIGKILGFQLAISQAPPPNEDYINDMLNVGWKNPELAITQISSQYSNYLELNKNLANSLWIPSISSWKNQIEKLGSTAKVIRITSRDQIENAIKTKWLPSPDYAEGIP